MDDRRIGTSIRAIRQRLHLRQEDLAAKAGVSRGTISRIERGLLANVTVGALRRTCTAVGASFEAIVRWQGGDLDRLINARHSAMHELVARLLGSAPGWVFAPEASFSIYGERGIIDILAWHAAQRIVLVIELKTELVDVNDLMGAVDRKVRLALRIAAQRGWAADRVAVWVVLADSAANPRRVAAHAATLRAAFPDDGRSVRRWLVRPDGRLRALGFLANEHHNDIRRDLGAIKRVRRVPNAQPTHTASVRQASERRSACSAITAPSKITDNALVMFV